MGIYVKQNGTLVPLANYSGGGTNITVDDELSETSENPVQNKVITDTIAELNQAIEDAKALRADLESYGMVKLSDSSTITDSTGIALPASEKNASIDGTLANQISSIYHGNTEFTTKNSIAISNPGWVRMFASTGHYPCVTLIGITKEFQNGGSQACLLAGSFNYRTTNFKNILGYANDVTKIRSVITSNNIGYIDIYYKAAYANKVVVSLMHMSYGAHNCYHAIEPQTVSEDVGDGFLITGSLDIVNTN